ncbi:unnamed protein product, partial [Laminaria digitata]
MSLGKIPPSRIRFGQTSLTLLQTCRPVRFGGTSHHHHPRTAVRRKQGHDHPSPSTRGVDLPGPREKATERQ